MLTLTKTHLRSLRGHTGDISVEVPGQAGFLYRIPITKKAALEVIEEADGNLHVCLDSTSLSEPQIIIRAPKR